jgi:hypothetical protein
MLTAFTAQPLVELRQRDKSKIEAILAYGKNVDLLLRTGSKLTRAGDRLLVGLNTGSLRIYRVNESQQPQDSQESQNPPLQPTPSSRTDDTSESQDPAPPAPKQRAVDLLREEEKFSKKPVQQLAIVKEANILISLSDSYVSLYDLQSYALQDRLEKTRGATLFAAASNIVKDATTGIPSIVSRLAVAVKRKVLLWTWHDGETTSEAEEFTLVATVKSLTWATGTKIVVGLDPGFVMVDIESANVSDINKPGGLEEEGGSIAPVKFGAVSSTGMGYMGMGSWVPKPMATKLGESELLLAKDVNTMFIDPNGKPIDKRQVPWVNAPEAIGYSYPYMLALQPPAKGVLEIRNPDTLSMLQSISLPAANFMHVPQPNISLAHAGKGFLVASDRIIWRMTALKYEAQIEALLAQSLFDEAISLVSMLEETLLLDKDTKLREIKMQKAQDLFDQRKYRASLELFSDAAAPPKRVIQQYPQLIAGDLSMVKQPDDDAENGGDDQNKKEPSLDGKKSPPMSPHLSPRKTMLGRLRAGTVESDAASVKSSKTDNADGASIKGKNVDEKLEGKDLLLAVNELCAFLAQTRVKLQKIMHPNGTLKTPLPINPPRDFKPDFHNLIVLEDGEEDVDWHKKLIEVATLVDTTLFRAYMLARPGLAGSLFRLDNFCDPLVIKEKLYETGRYADLIDFLHGKRLHREALELLEKFGKDTENEAISPNLRGPQRTVAYLQQLPPEQIQLILEYGEWPLRLNPNLGMEVFLADTENAETLPRDEVLEYLIKIDTNLAMKYLEHIINELNEMTPEFHQKLIDFYLEKLKSKETDAEKGGFESTGARNEMRLKLEELLQSSAQYNRMKAFRQLPTDGVFRPLTVVSTLLTHSDPDFYESRAIVLSKMGQHKQALQIYVFQVKDYDKAEEYCNQTYLATQDSQATLPAVPVSDSKDDTPSIYHTLLALYLNPPPPNEPNLKPALALLSNHGARLPASQTLALIPPDLKIATLESYFTGRIRTANTAMTEDRIAARLRAVQRARVEETLLEERNRRVEVGEDRLCGVCMKRFGGSAVRVYPDGRVVHYGCFQRSSGSAAGRDWGRTTSGLWS